MNIRHRIARRLGIGVAGFWLLSAAAIGGTVLLGGCNKIDDLTSSDDDGSGSKNLTVQPAASTVAPGGSVAVTATATDDKGSPANDGTAVAFTVDVGSIAPAVALTTAGKAAATYAAGAAEGTAKITATPAGATPTVSIEVKAGAPAATGDEFPYGIQNIAWDNRGTNLPVHNWPVTAKISSAYLRRAVAGIERVEEAVAQRGVVHDSPVSSAASARERSSRSA